MISVIIPVFNEEKTIEEALLQLQWLRKNECEILVVDGGSSDRSLEIARQYADKVVLSEKGRAVQMNAGAEHASGNLLVFLHIDTFFDKGSFNRLVDISSSDPQICGRFDVRLSGNQNAFRVIERLMNIRSRITSIVTGDHAMFISRQLFIEVGGYSAIPLMEDIELSKRLKKLSKPVCLNECVTTSSRRWEKNGIVVTVLTMWILRLAYWAGVKPSMLERIYYKSG